MQHFSQPTSNLNFIELTQTSENRSDTDPFCLCLIPVWIGITISHFLHSLLFDQIIQRKCISAVLWQNLLKYAPSIDPNAFNSFLIIVTHGESHGIFTSSPQTMFSNILMQRLFLLLSPYLFFIRPSKVPPKVKQDFNKFWKPPHALFFHF